MKLSYIVDADNIQVKEYFKQLGFSRNFGKNIKLYGKIYLNGQEVKNHYLVHKGDKLDIVYSEKLNEEIESSNYELDIIYEDEQLLVINKPNNLSSQPSRKHPSDNIVSVIKNYFLKQNIHSNVHIINRLDYSTTGLMLVGKNGFIHQQLQDKTVRKYLAYVHGTFTEKTGTISLPIKAEEKPSILRKIAEDGQPAITHYRVIKELSDSTYLELQLETGRTHQIRLHLSSITHPIFGDKLYGSSDGDLKLHSYYLEFYHPMKKEVIKLYNYPSWFKEETDA